MADKPTNENVVVINSSGQELPELSELSTMEQLELLERNSSAMQQAAEISFEDALADAVTAESDVVVADKEELLGVPFVIIEARVNQGNFGPFVTLVTKTADDKTTIINDGSTGIAAQMAGLIRKYGEGKPIFIKNGLRKSVYYVDKDTGQVVGKQPQQNAFAQATYYLAV